MHTTHETAQQLAQHYAECIAHEVERIRGMYGYTEKDERGVDPSIWLGTSLHRIEDAANAILKQLAS